MTGSPARTSPIAAALLVAIAAAVACKKEAPGTAAPADAGSSYGDEDSAAEEPAAEGLTSLESELDRLESDLAAAGAGPDAQPESSDPQEAEARCHRICELSSAVCDLESRICALADEHAGDDRYTAACARAGGDCERASEACRVCSE